MGGLNTKTVGKRLSEAVNRKRRLDREISYLKQRLTFEEKEKVLKFMKKLLKHGRD